MFLNRRDAGERLAEALRVYRPKGPLVLAIPRGGVEVGYQVAMGLGAELAALVVRKLPLPRNPEAGFGAIAEDGSTFVFEDMVAALPPEVVERIVRAQQDEIRRRVAAFRKGKDLPKIVRRTVILVDDGIAMGSTVRAAIAMCRKREAEEIVVAAPVASSSTAEELAALADNVVIVQKPPWFRAVAQSYVNWYDVPDDEVVSIMHAFEQQWAS